MPQSWDEQGRPINSAGQAPVQSWDETGKPITQLTQQTGVAKPAHPVEPAGGKVWDRISGTYLPEAMHAAINPLIRPHVSAAFQAKHPYVGGAAAGAEEFAGSLTSPINMGLMATGGLEEKLAVQGLGAIGKIAGLGFMGQMGIGTYESGKAAYESWQQGNKSEATKYATETLLGGLATAGTAAHVSGAVKWHPAAETAVAEDPSRAPVKVPGPSVPTPRTVTPPVPAQTPAHPAEQAASAKAESGPVTTPHSLQDKIAQLRKQVEALPSEAKPPAPIVGQDHASAEEAIQAVRDEKAAPRELPRDPGKLIRSAAGTRALPIEPEGYKSLPPEERPLTPAGPSVKPAEPEEVFTPVEKVKPGSLPKQAQTFAKNFLAAAPGAEKQTWRQQFMDSMNKWTGGTASEDLEKLHAPAWDALSKKTGDLANFLDRNLKFGDDKLKETYEAAMAAKASGVGHLKNPAEGKTGALEGGIAHAAREAIDQGLGKRRVSVSDLNFKRQALAAAKDIAEGGDSTIPVAADESPEFKAERLKLEDAKERLAQQVGAGADPAHVTIKVAGKDVPILQHMKSIEIALQRQIIKTTGAAPEAAFELGPAPKETRVGKAIEPHEGLPIITQKIWQAMNDTKKHLALPTREEREALLPKLQEKARFQGDVSKLLLQRAGEKGSFNLEGVTPYARVLGRVNKMVDSALVARGVDPRAFGGDLSEKAVGAAKAAGIEAWRITPEFPAGKAGWYTPDGEHFMSALHDAHADVIAQVFSPHADYSVLMEKVGEHKAQGYLASAMQAGFIRKEDSNSFETFALDSDAINTIQTDLIKEYAQGKPPTDRERIYIDNHASKWSAVPSQRLEISAKYFAEEPDLVKHIGRAIREERMAGQRGGVGDKPFYDMLAETKDAIIQASDALKEDMQHTFGISPEKAEQLYAHMHTHGTSGDYGELLNGVTEHGFQYQGTQSSSEIVSDMLGWVGEIKKGEAAYERGRQSLHSRGVSGTRLLGGMAAGGTTGAAVGGAVGGPVGAIAGAGIGTIVGGLTASASYAGLHTDLLDLQSKTGETLGAMQDWARRNFAATWGVSDTIRTAVDTWKGNTERARSVQFAMTEAYRTHFDKYSKDDVIAYHDRLKNGIADPDPYNQQYISQVKRPIEDSQHLELERALNDLRGAKGAGPKPLAYLQFHDRIMWKDPKAAAAFSGRFYGLYGDKGAIKQHILNSMGEGIAQGLEPEKWNPIENDRMAWGATAHFIEGLKLMTHAVDNNLVEFVGLGDRPTNGKFVQPKGFGWETFFPASSGEGLVKAGAWHADPDFARLFENHNEVDLIRRNAAMRAVLGVRAALGQQALFGTFHMALVTGVSTAQQASIGLRGLTDGISHLDISQALDGLREFARAPLAPYHDYKLGQLAQEGARAPDINAWMQTPNGQKLLKQFPNADHFIDLMWKTGGENFVRTPTDVQNRLYDSWKNEWKQLGVSLDQGRLLSAAGHGALAAAGTVFPLPAMSLMMKPLFETYIPALKMGMYMHEVGNELLRNYDDIMSGKTSQHEVSRNVVRRIEDFAGEYNTSNLYLPKTMNTIVTAWYRSFGFRFGTVEAAGHALSGQLGEFKRAAVEAKAGHVYIPKLQGDMANWLTLFGTYAMANAIGTYMLTGTAPHGMDYIAMRGKAVQPNGKPTRYWVPGYASQAYNALRNPGGFITGGQSDIVAHFFEALRNEDNAGQQIAPVGSKPGESTSQLVNFAKRIAFVANPYSDAQFVNIPGLNAPYPVPGNFIGSNFQRLRELGVPAWKAGAASLGGFNVASTHLDMSAAEELLQERRTLRQKEGPYTAEQNAQYHIENQLTRAVRLKEPTSALIKQARAAGMSDEKINNAATRGQEPYMQWGAHEITIDDAFDVAQAGNSAERAQLKPVLEEKMDRFMDGPADAKEKARIKQRWENFKNDRRPSAQ